jgi:hypothetical protein
MPMQISTLGLAKNLRIAIRHGASALLEYFEFEESQFKLLSAQNFLFHRLTQILPKFSIFIS